MVLIEVTILLKLIGKTDIDLSDDHGCGHDNNLCAASGSPQPYILQRVLREVTILLELMANSFICHSENHGFDRGILLRHSIDLNDNDYGSNLRIESKFF